MNKRARNKFDYQALAQFRYEIRRFINFSEQAARDAGIEPQQHQALLAIEGLPVTQRATIGGLAERLQIQHHSAVGLVNRLEAEGLLRRTSSRADRREVLLRVTRRAPGFSTRCRCRIAPNCAARAALCCGHSKQR